MRDRRSFIRKSEYRDARLIVIACEGAVTEPEYFDAVRRQLIPQPSRLHIEILKNEDNKSAPEYISKALDTYSKRYSLQDTDELWIVIDYDRWGERKLSQESARAVQKNYFMAVSRPCFEFWLLLHFIDPDELTDELVADLEKRGCKAAKSMLKKLLTTKPPGVRKVELYMPKTPYAIELAKKLDTDPEYRWPNSVVSRVYRLMESVLS